MSLAGKFIVVDGPDGSGKGTQIERLCAWIAQQGVACTRTRDPGGTEIGDRIRHVLLGFDLSQMDARCEALLFMASRAQLVAEVIRPALANGHAVVCDRFISSTCAYQVAAGFPRSDVLQLGRLAVAETWPHLTLILDVPAEVGFERTGRKPHQSGRRARDGAGQIAMFEGAAPDAMERRPLDFHRRVRQLFLELPMVYPAPVRVLDANRSADEVFADMCQSLVTEFTAENHGVAR
jgi:dTMP kinase